MSTISENIAFYRRKKGLTQKDLAEKTGLSRSFISQIENSTNNPSEDSLYKISNVLNISISELKGEGKNFIKNEDTELIKLLIKITADEKIKWENFDDSSGISDIIYKVTVRSTEYELSCKNGYSGNDVYIAYIGLDIKNLITGYHDTIDAENSDEELLYDLLDTIQNLERDKSPKFELINELENIDKDDDATPDSTSVPF